MKHFIFNCQIDTKNVESLCNFYCRVIDEGPPKKDYSCMLKDFIDIGRKGISKKRKERSNRAFYRKKSEYSRARS